MGQSHVKSTRAKAVTLTEYKWKTGADKDGVHSSVTSLVNDKKWKEEERTEDIGGDRVTIIISTPLNWGGSLTSTPGHAGIVLWNSTKNKYQTFGMISDGTFDDEWVNVHQFPESDGDSGVKVDKDFKIWYFTCKIDGKVYKKMQARMSTLGTKKVVPGKFFVARGWKEDGSYSCVTAVDTILVAGGLSKAIASLTSSPYGYAQTFSSAFWYISYAEGYKHM